MFSSLSKSLAGLSAAMPTISLSPKALLAQYLAKALAEFFVVDVHMIETNLLSETHVLLRHIQIKQRLLRDDPTENDDSDAVLLSGTVQSIEFRWTWGRGLTGDGKGVSAYISDVQLLISGVHIRLEPVSRQAALQILAVSGGGAAVSPTTATTTGTTTTSPTNNSSTDDAGDWKTQYMQQILDHLLLRVTDVEMVVVLPADSSINKDTTSHQQFVFRLKDIELKTLGRTTADGVEAYAENDNSLEQHMRLGSLVVCLEQQHSTNHQEKQVYPLLDAFGYTAIVKRVSGRRFLDGIGNGLVVTGNQQQAREEEAATTAPSRLRLHAGLAQVQALLMLQDMLGIVSDAETASNEPIRSSLPPPSNTQQQQHGGKNHSSVFILPVPWVAVVLENQTEVKLDGCTVFYRTDGSECAVDCGSGGILIDNELVTETNIGRTLVDLVHQTVSITPYRQQGDAESFSEFFDSFQEEEIMAEDGGTPSSTVVLRLSCTEQQARNAWLGVDQVLALYDRERSNATETATIMPSSSSSSSEACWSVAVEGVAECRLGVSGDRWLQATVMSPKLSYGSSTRDETVVLEQQQGGNTEPLLPGLGFLVEWQEMKFQSSSSRDSVIRIPATKTTNSGRGLTVDGRIVASFESIDAVWSAQAIVEEAAAIFSTNVLEETPAPANTRDGLPMCLTLPMLECAVGGTATATRGKITLQNVKGSGLSLSCDWVNAEGRYGAVGEAVLEMTSVAAYLGDDRTEITCAVAQCSVPSLGSLNKPVEKVSIQMEQGVCSVACSEIAASTVISLFEGSKKQQAGGFESPAVNPGAAELPFDIRLTAPSVILDFLGSESSSKLTFIGCEGLNVFASRVAGGTTDHQCSAVSSVAGLSLGAQCKALTVELPTIASGCFSGVSADVLLGNAGPDSVGSPLCVPGLGKLSGASVKIQHTSKLSVPGAGYLAKPLTPVSVTLEDGLISVRLCEIEWAREAVVSATERDVPTNAPDAASSLLPTPPFPIELSLPSLTITNRSPNGAQSGFVSFGCSRCRLLNTQGSGNSISLQVPGELFCRVGVSGERWLQVTANCLKLSYIPSPSFSGQDDETTHASQRLPFLIEWQGVEFESSCGVAVTVPTAKYIDGDNSLIVEGSVLASLGTIDSIWIMQAIVQEVSNSFSRDVATEIETKKIASSSGLAPPISMDGLAVCLKLPLFEMSVSGPTPGKITMQNIEGSGLNWHCDRLNAEGCYGGVDAVVGLSSIAVRLSDNSAELSCSVSNLTVFDMGSLTMPVEKVAIKLEQDVCSVVSTAIAASTIISLTKSSQQEKPNGSENPGLVEVLRLPFDIKFSTPSVILDFVDSVGLGQREFIGLEGLEVFAIRGTGSAASSRGFSVGLQCNTLTVDLPLTASGCFGNVSADMVVGNSVPDSIEAPLHFPGLGTVSGASARIEHTSKLSIPKAGFLEKPLAVVSASLKDGTIFVSLDDIEWNQVAAEKPNDYGGSISAPPLPLQLHVARLAVNQATKKFFSCRDSTVRIEKGADSDNLVEITVSRCLDVSYLDMVNIPSLVAKTNLSRLDTLEKLYVEAPNMELCADFFSGESWSESLEGSAESVVYRLPFVQIREIDLVLTIKGGIVSVDNARLHLREYNGDGHADSNAVSRHYVKIVKERLPFLFSKAKVLGTNVGDAASQTVASVAMNSSVYGALVGVAGRDAVGAALTQGKKARGASETDGYRFGDFSRGIAKSVGTAAKKGARMRGGDSYVPGDATVGAVTSAAAYASENKTRLSSAGGSGVGMVVGMAVAGPIGLVAGSLIGGKMACAAVSKACGADPEKKVSKQSTRLSLPAPDPNAGGYVGAPGTSQIAPDGRNQSRSKLEQDTFSLFEPEALAHQSPQLQVVPEAQNNSQATSSHSSGPMDGDPFAVFESKPTSTIPRQNPVAHPNNQSNVSHGGLQPHPTMQDPLSAIGQAPPTMNTVVQPNNQGNLSCGGSQLHSSTIPHPLSAISQASPMEGFQVRPEGVYQSQRADGTFQASSQQFPGPGLAQVESPGLSNNTLWTVPGGSTRSTTELNQTRAGAANFMSKQPDFVHPGTGQQISHSSAMQANQTWTGANCPPQQPAFAQANMSQQISPAVPPNAQAAQAAPVNQGYGMLSTQHAQTRVVAGNTTQFPYASGDHAGMPLQQPAYAHAGMGQPNHPSANPGQQVPQATKPDAHQGYRFGDLTRSAIARGKQNRGQDSNSSYKFGDFTRGLFSK